MRTSTLLPFLSLFFCLPFSNAQNYLRVADPDWWGAPSSNQPTWYEDYDHGQFEELRIVAKPQGIFTEIEVYATITHSPEAWSWNDFEIIWQFDLPQNTIVHDAWLWVGQDIIKADVVDFWTALETYTGIVDYNEDPLFFYQLSDKRYELRVYPLTQGQSRRLKLSFLVPASWDETSVTQDLLQSMFQCSDYPPPMVEIAVPVNGAWGGPTIFSGNTSIELTDTVTGGSGDLLHFAQMDGEAFLGADNIRLNFQAPFNGGPKTFASVYADAGENYYQMVHIPDWETIVQLANAKKTLILLDYDSSKTSLSKAQLLSQLQVILEAHFTPADAINVAVSTASGIRFMSDTWWGFDNQAFPDTLAGLLDLMETDDLQALLSEGFSWATAKGDATGLFLLAANEDYFYPPVADDVFANIASTIPAAVPLTLFDYQDENVSEIFYNNQAYQGNDYFYQLLQDSVGQFNHIVLRDMSDDFTGICEGLFPAFTYPSGTMDFVTYMLNGVNYQAYNIGSNEISPTHKGVIMQTGKYLGAFPMNIHAGLISDDGQFWNLNETVDFDNAMPGDTLMREIWYGPHLKYLEAIIGSNADRLHIIEQSKAERVLTGLTAFLALEPSLGGEPCIDCLFNNGTTIIGTNEVFDISKVSITITPNPAADFATITLKYPGQLTASDWTATIYNPAGSLVATLGAPGVSSGQLQWKWAIGQGLEGMYFVKVSSEYGEITGKIIVLR